MKILKVKDVKTPERGTANSAGIDFFVPNTFAKIHVFPNRDILIPSGIKVEVPRGFALIVFDKSGVATRKKLKVGACVIDEDYQGEIHLHVHNIGKEVVMIEPGMKLVQMILIPVLYDSIEEVSSIDELYEAETERGEGGFGSTGK